MNMETRRRHQGTGIVAALCATALILAPLAGMAGTYNWKSNAGSTAWAAGGNWDEAAAPANNINDDTAQFNKASYTQQPNAGTASINGVVIGGSSAAVTLAGTALSIGSGGVAMQNGAAGSTISSPTSIAAAQNWENNSINALSVGGAVNFANPLTLTAGVFIFNNTGTGTAGLKVDGSTAWLRVQNPALGASGNTLTLNSGRLSADWDSAKTFANNPLAITGDVTLGDYWTYRGGLTFSHATQSIADNVTVTALSGVTFGSGLTIGNNVQFRGPATVTLPSTASIGNRAITIGDNAASGSTSGNIAVATQNAMGTGAYTVNFGGTLNPTANFSPVNVVTVNNGGTFMLRPPGAGASVTFNSGATVASGASATYSLGSNLFLPTEGVLFINYRSASLTVGGAAPNFTGTMAFGGDKAANPPLTFSLAPTIGGARTLAFNGSATYGEQTGPTFGGGLILNGDLAIAGSGNGGLAGFAPIHPAGSFGGSITQDADRSITLAMAPGGMVQINGSATGWKNTDINSGTLRLQTSDGLGSGSATLDGGALRLQLAAAFTKNLAVGPQGGVLEGGNGSRTYAGGLSGSTPLVLRSNNGRFTVSGNNSAFTGGLKLGAFGSPSVVTLDGNNALGASGMISVPAGVAFGGTAVRAASLGAYGNNARFSTSSDSVYDINNVDTAPDLSASGFDRDVWIGLSAGSVTLSGYTLPTGITTYRLVPVGNSTLTGSVFSGGGNGLTVWSGAVITDLDSSATDVIGSGKALTLASSQSYGGPTLVTGAIRNSLAAGGVGAPTLVSSAGLTGTSAITVDKGATLTLQTAGTSGATDVPVTVKGGSTLNVNVANAITSSGALTLGGESGGGTYAATGAQTLKSLTVATGANIIGGTGALTLSDGVSASTYNRNVGGAVSFGAGTAFTYAPTGTGGSSGGSNPIFLGAVVNSLQSWAAFAFGTVAAATYGTVNDLTSDINKNVDVNANGTIAGIVSYNSIRGSNAGGNVTLDVPGVITLQSGGVLFSPNSSTQRGLTFSGSGTLSSGAADYFFFVEKLGRSAAQAGHYVDFLPQLNSAVPLTKAGGGILTLSNAGNAITDVYVNGGEVRSQTTGALGTTGTIYLNGGTLSSGTAAQIHAGKGLTVGAQGGTLTDTGAGNAITLGGNVALNGTLSVSGTAAKALANGSGSAISGDGVLKISSAGLTTLSGPNAGANTYKGGLILGVSGSSTGHVRVRLDNPTALGASIGSVAILDNDARNASSGLTFTDNVAANAAGLTVANPITAAASFYLQNWELDGPVTFTGRIFGNRGLLLQGADSGAAVSETVLSGTLSVGGTPSIFSFGTSALAQNFVNGQAGITLGGTGYRGGVPITATTEGYLNKPDGTSQHVDGAEGYVRFAGADSFIPGAVGPGFLAALRKGGADSAKRFGFLLTGGSTYALPEGKSILIGTLGSGTAQVNGTFGATGSGTAVFLGSSKLAGFSAGDINVHGNAADDNASLNLFVGAGATNTLGNTGTSVVFTPTYGDSGASTAVTLLSDRTGTTTLNKTGPGVLRVDNIAFKDLAGATIDTAKVHVNVSEGTLAGKGTIGGNVTFQSGSKFGVDLLTNDTSDLLTVAGAVDLTGATLTANRIAGNLKGPFAIISASSVSGKFANPANVVMVGGVPMWIVYDGTSVTLRGGAPGTKIFLR